MTTHRLTPFAEQLRRYRRERSLTQEGLAERAGLSARGIRALERGERTAPHNDTVQLLADALQLSTGDRAALQAAASQPAAGDTLHPVAVFPAGSFLGARPSSPLIAREGEMDRMLGFADDVERGEGRLVMLAGEPGVGKTRLAQEVSLRLQTRGFLVATGRCYEPERSVAYYPFVEALAAVHDAAPPEIWSAISHHWPHIERLLPDSPAAADPEEFGGEDVQQRLFWAVAHFLAAAAEIHPLALLLDDLQWADESSLKLLQYVSRATRASRIFLLGTFRDVDINRRHPLDRTLHILHREGLLTELVVRRLPREGAAAMMASMLDRDEVSEALVALLYERTDGNPFFLQEVVRALIERGDLVVADGAWNSQMESAIEIPRSVRSAIGERFSRLSGLSQDVLSDASVLGQSFAVESLIAMRNRPREQVDDALDEALLAGVIRAGERDRFSFSHALMQMTLYEELPPRKRLRLHLLAAEALERLPADTRHRRATEIAWQFRQAGEERRALPHAMLAGDEAEAVFAHAEALQHYHTALELAHDVEDRRREVEALEKLGVVLRLSMRYDEALDLLERAAAAYRAMDDPEGEARATYQVGVALYMKGQPREAGARVRATAERLEHLHGPPSFQRALAYVYWALAMPSCLTGRYRDILATSARIAELGAMVGDTRLLAAAAWMRGYGLVVVGAPGEARSSLEEAVPFFESTDDRWWLAQVTCQIGRTYLHEGEVDRAENYLQRTLGLFEEIHDQAELAWASCYMGDAKFIGGDWAEARRHYERSADLARTTVPRFYSHALLHLAELSLLEGRTEEALAAIEEGLEVAEGCSEVAAIRKAHRLLAEQDLVRSDPERAVARLEPLLAGLGGEGPHAFPPPVLAEAYACLGNERQASQLTTEQVERFRRQNRLRSLTRWLQTQGNVCVRQQQWYEAQQAYTEAASLAHAISYAHAEAVALHEYGMLLVQRGEPEQGRERLEAALAGFRRLGAQPHAERTEAALHALYSAEGPIVQD